MEKDCVQPEPRTLNILRIKLKLTVHTANDY
jgi:hypothetical protein